MLGEAPRTVRGLSLEAHEVVRILAEAVPGIHADPGSRRGYWHPNMDQFQGLYYYHKHLCSMDRGTIQQWPEWTTEEDLVEVPLDYALRHEDLPVLSLGEHGEAVMEEWSTACVMRPMLKEVKRIGWAEVFWQVLNANLGLTQEWFARSFHVPMDWCGQMKKSPVAASYEEAKRRGFAV